MLTKIVAGARKLTQGGLRPVLISAAVAFGVAQLQQLAAEAEDRAEDAETNHKVHTDHVALLQAQISDLEAQALNSVRAAIASGIYDYDVQLRAAELQQLADAADPTSQPGPVPSAAGWAAAQQGTPMAECGQPFPCDHAPDGGNHPVKG